MTQTQGHDPALAAAAVPSPAPSVIDLTSDAAPSRAPERPKLTIAESARAANVSKETIKRRLGDGSFPNAAKEIRANVETWVIPVEDLLAAGFRLNAPTPAPQPEPAPAAVAPAPAEESAVPALAELAALRAELDLERARRRDAEVAVEMVRSELRVHETYRETLSVAMRMLEAGPRPVEAPAPQQQAEPRRRWLRR